MAEEADALSFLSTPNQSKDVSPTSYFEFGITTKTSMTSYTTSSSEFVVTVSL